jgi:hypothetical protein
VQVTAYLTNLLQLRVFRLGLLQDGDVGVGVFPEGEEIFVCGECPDAGGIGIRSMRSSRLQSICPRHAQMRQRSRPAVRNDPAVVENLLEFGRRQHYLVQLPSMPLRAHTSDRGNRLRPLVPPGRDSLKECRNHSRTRASISRSPRPWSNEVTSPGRRQAATSRGDRKL